MLVLLVLAVSLTSEIMAAASPTSSPNSTIKSHTEVPVDIPTALPFDVHNISEETRTLEWNDNWPTEWQTEENFPFYSSIKDRQTLSDELLHDYNKHILPYSGKNAFNIAINVSLRAVGEIDEPEEKLSTVLWLTYKWNDENIEWRQDENKVTDVTFGWIDVWKPVLRVDNPHADSSNRQATDRSFDTVIYTSNGSAWFDEMMVTRTTCDLDMTYYPFDIQTCAIKLSVVGESKFPFKLNIHLNEDESPSDDTHGLWVLIYKNTTTCFGKFEITLKFERRPLFIMLNILLPIIVLALLTPIVFILPKKSGERVGFAITMLLAISVYMTIVSDHLPQNSEPMPLILIMTFIWYLVDASVVFIVIINLRINTMKNKGPLSRWLLTFVRITRKVFRRREGLATETGSSEEAKECIGKSNAEDNDDVKTDEGPREQDMNEPCDEVCKPVTWQDLSHCIDRWCFVSFYFIKVTLPIIFFLVMKSESTV